MRRLKRFALTMASFGLYLSLSSYAFAAPPASPYAPGETLSPSCAPGDTNCTVTAPARSGANSDLTSIIGLTTPLAPSLGGTGLSAAPSYGMLPLGNSSNTYTMTATSALGLLAPTA